MSNKNRIQKEIVDSLPDNSHGLLQLAPRVGKTKIGIDILKKEKVGKVLWVTPSTKLRDEDIPNEFLAWKAKTILNKTDIICYASLANHKGKYDKIILDEYQDVTDGNMEPLFNGQIKYKSIIGLSGTHPKQKEKLDIYKKLNLEVLKSITIDEAVSEGLIADYQIKVIECRLDSKDKYIKAGSKNKTWFQTEVNRYDYLTRMIRTKLFSTGQVPAFMYINRMRFIYTLKSKTEFAKKFVSNLTGRTLVFTGSIDQAEYISDKTYHSKKSKEDLEDFVAGKIDILACVNSGGVGYTYRNVDNVVIVQVNSDTKGDATQKIARSLVLQEGYRANIYILSIIDTVDEEWKNKVLQSFDTSKVQHVSYVNYI